MGNEVWHNDLKIECDTETVDPALWALLHAQDRRYADEGVRVPDRGLQCAGICRDQGVVAWMHLRQRSNGRREAVHQHAEDEERHKAPARGPEHTAWQERAERAAKEGGF